MSQSTVDVFQKRSTIVPHVWVATGCLIAAGAFDVWAFAFRRGFLFILVPLTIGAFALLLGWGTRLARAGEPAIVLSPDGIMIRSFAAQAIPWQAIRSATLFSPFGSSSPNIAIVFDPGRARQFPRRRQSFVEADPVFEVTLKASHYDMDPKAFENVISERIAAARTEPWSGKITTVRVRGNHYSNAFIALSISSMLLLFGAEMIEGLHDNRILARFAAPNYPRQIAAQRTFAQDHITSYPRDTRVRLDFATILADAGRLREAQAELMGALADRDALRVIDDYLCRGRSACSFRPHIEDRIYMLLAVVLAKQHKIGAAKAAMAGLCHYAKDGDMPMLIKLDLCHYE